MFTHLRPRCGGSHSGPQPGTRDALPPWARTAHDGSTHPSPRATLFWHTCATVTAAGTGTIPATTPTARSTSRSRSPDRCRPSPSAIPWEAEQPCGQPLTPRCTSPRPRAMAAARRTRRAVERKASRRRTWRARPGDQPPSLRAVRQQGPNGRSLRRHCPRPPRGSRHAAPLQPLAPHRRRLRDWPPPATQPTTLSCCDKASSLNLLCVPCQAAELARKPPSGHPMSDSAPGINRTQIRKQTPFCVATLDTGNVHAC